jgi:peptidoglycan DL-endopeptidase CwlO
VFRGRNRLAALLSGGALLLGLSLVGSNPSYAEPDIDQVQTRVDRLYHEAEQAQEHYHDIQLKLQGLQRDLRGLRADERRQADRLGAVQSQVEGSIVRAYQGEDLSTVGQVVLAEDPSAFLSQLSTATEYNTLQSGLYDDYSTELKALRIRQEATQSRTDEIAAAHQEAAEAKASVDDKLEEAKKLLATLKEKERRAIVSRGSGAARVPAAVTSDVPASGRGAAAVRFALAQVGDAYVYGGTGPSGWDCSGLTMVSWGQAGVGLPHSSSAQFGSGPHIPASALRPGDLVFYYSPISHVAIYIGNGMIVHAAHPGAGVRVAGLYSMPFSGAVRPG